MSKRCKDSQDVPVTMMNREDLTEAKVIEDAKRKAEGADNGSKFAKKIRQQGGYISPTQNTLEPVYRKMSLVPVQRPEWLAYSEPIKFDFSNLTEGQAVYIYGWRTLETNLYGTKICYLITDEMPVITNDNKLRAQNYKQEEFMQVC